MEKKSNQSYKNSHNNGVSSVIDMAYEKGFIQDKIEHFDNTTRFSRQEQGDEESSVTIHHIMPGVDLFYNHFSSNETVEVSYAPEIEDYIEINHCRRGRFGCQIGEEEKYVYLGEGEMEANLLGVTRLNPEFPLGFYDGISVLLDVSTMAPALSPLFPMLASQVLALKEQIKESGGAMLIRAIPQLNHIFEELYYVNPSIEQEYVKLKVLELLLMLQALPYERSVQPTRYFKRSDIEKLKALHAEAIARIDEMIPFGALAQKYGLGLTLAKSCFKEIYGSPYYTYMKRYRMHKAVHYLENETFSVAKVAGLVGYDNASKFSAAFRSIMGCSPKEYRKHCDHMEHLRLLGVEVE